MKTWLVPIMVGAFVGGAVLGSTMRASTNPKAPPREPASTSFTEVAGSRDLLPESAREITVKEADEPGEDGELPGVQNPGRPRTRLELFKRLALRLPKPAVVRALWQPVWNSRELERTTFELSRKIEDPEILEALLFVLDNIQHKDLQSEVLNEVHTAKSPSRRRFLAGVLGAPYQESEFLDAALALVEDEDPGVVVAALTPMHLGRFRGEDRDEVSRLLQRAAGPDRPAEIRAAALEALCKASDPGVLRFLLDVLAGEKDSTCRAAAVRAMSRYQFDSGEDETVLAEAARMFWRVWSDASEADATRRSAAYGLREASSASKSHLAIGASEWDFMMSKVRGE